MADTFLLNSPLINYFHYATGTEVGELADAGTLEFFEADDHSTHQDTYSDPLGAVVNTNPIVLSAIGSAPPIYLKDDKYYIEIKDKLGNVLETLDDYIPNGSASGGGDVTKQDENILANSQFIYQVEFSESETTPGLIEQSEVHVGAAWGFFQDAATTTKNVITFNDIATEAIEGNPLDEIQIDSSDVQTGETAKDLRQRFGFVNQYQEEPITFSFQMQNKNAGTVPVELLIQKNYGPGGSDEEFISLTTFNVPSTRTKFSFNYTLPTNSGKTIGPNSSIWVVLRIALGQTCSLTITNALILPGTVATPVYPECPYSEMRSRSLGVAADIGQTGVPYNYAYMKQIRGQYIPTQETGQMKVFTIDKQPANFHRCDGATLNVKDYTIPYVANRRLFNEIGNTFGGSGELVVTSDGPTVKFDSAIGARQNSNYTAGDLLTKVAVTNTIVGLKTGVSAALQTATSVRCTYVDKFTQAQDSATSTTCGYAATTPPAVILSSANVTLGTPSVQAVFDVNFLSNNISDYKTDVYTGGAYNINKLGWQSQTTNVGFSVTVDGLLPPAFVANVINISVDGKIGGHSSGLEVTEIIPFVTSKTIAQNVQIFIDTISNPFEWTVKFNSVPAASEYFEYSSQTIDYYAWYTVDGVGVDPALAGPTGVNVIINSADTTAIVAQKTATAINDLTFDLPTSATHLPVIPAGGLTKLDWYISF